MEEMMDDMLEDDEDELEEEADAEVEKVLFDITDGKLGAAGTVHDELPVCFLLQLLAYHSLLLLQVEKEAADAEEERNLEEYQKQLNELLSG